MYVILLPNLDPNHARDQNLIRDRDLGLKAIIVNDHAALKIKPKHCQGIHFGRFILYKRVHFVNSRFYFSFFLPFSYYLLFILQILWPSWQILESRIRIVRQGRENNSDSAKANSNYPKHVSKISSKNILTY